MAGQKEIKITTRDRILRAWENSMEMVRDFENYSHEIEDAPEVAELFSEFAKEVGIHASKLRQLMHQYSNSKN